MKRLYPLLLLGIGVVLLEGVSWWTGFGPNEQHPLFLYKGPFYWDVPLHRQSFDGDKEVFERLDLDHDHLLHLKLGPEGVFCPELDRVHALYHELEISFLNGNLKPSTLALPEGHPLTVEAFVETTRWMRLTTASLQKMDTDHNLLITKEEFLGAPLSRPFILGTDNLGRDLLKRTLIGLHTSLLLTLIAGTAAFAIGLVYGAIAGLVGGMLDTLLMRLVDVLYGLPYIMLVVVLIALTGPGFWNLVLAVLMVQWLPVARLVRPLARSISQEPYITSAQGFGESWAQILRLHVLPNLLRPAMGITAVLTSNVIKQEVLLSFLGLGITPPQPSLGTLVAEGAGNISVSAWQVLPPSLIVFLLLLGLNWVTQKGD